MPLYEVGTFSLCTIEPKHFVLCYLYHSLGEIWRILEKKIIHTKWIFQVAEFLKISKQKTVIF